jgi:putative endonuclease
MIYYVYILRCADNSLYTGIAKDLKARLKYHNYGKASKYTRSRRPVLIEYYEEVDSLSQARTRENEIKKWNHAKKEELIGRVSLGCRLGTTSA